MEKYLDEVILSEAHKLGMEAGNRVIPTPMAVVDTAANKAFYVSDGVCGFAWISIHPANCSIARTAKKLYGARTSSRGGMQIWVNHFGQSLARKEAYAQAFAYHLTEMGVKAYAGSNID